MSEPQNIVHPFAPLYDKNCKILVLGSFPSVKSREQNFFYGHPQNRFWRLVAMLFGEEIPQTIEQKRALALKHHIAMWDVIHSCTVTGSSDSSIKDVVPNDLSTVLQNSAVTKIFCNGALSYKLYEKYIFPKTGIKAVKLPSTSPANAAYSLDRLAQSWIQITEQ